MQTMEFTDDVATRTGLQAMMLGAALNARCRDLLLQTGALTAAVPAAELTIARRRSLMHEAGQLSRTELRYPVHSSDLQIALPGRSLPARLFEPEHVNSDVLLVFFHGGGWVIGDLNTHHPSCQFLAHHLGMKLLAVEYRKSPEHVFPAPCDDAIEALAWAHANKARWGCQRVAVAGDSAGGHLSAVAMYAQPELVAGALLFYPVTDIQVNNDSYSQRGAGPGLTGDGMRWFWEQFLGSALSESMHASKDPRAVPMRQTWRQVPPPAVITAAWHDPLYDEAVTYAQLLSRAGGRVLMQHAPDMAHGFLRQAYVSPSARSHVLAAVHAFVALVS
jgi:acetyl esterase